MGACAEIGAVEGVFNPSFSSVNPAALGNGAFQFAFSNPPGAGFTDLGSTTIPDCSSDFSDPQTAEHPAPLYRLRSP